MDPAATPQTPQADAFRLAEPDLAIYSILKLEVYRRLHEEPERAAASWISAARLAQTFAHMRGGRTASPELLQATSYYFRERLCGLNHGTFLRGDGTRRRNLAYAWNEPVTPAQREHYGHLHRLLGGDVHLARDVQILYDAFGQEPFTERDSLRIFRERHRAIVGKAASHGFHQFVLQRIARLEALDMVCREGRQIRLRPEAQQVLHWLDVLVFRAEPRPPSRPRVA